MIDILEEASNDAKDEKRIILFYKMLLPVIITTILIVVIMTCYNWYKGSIDSHNQKMGDILLDLTSNNEQFGNQSLEKLIQDSGNHQSELAEIRRVTLILDSANKSDALKYLESIIENTSYYTITTSFARLLWLNFILDEKPLSNKMQSQARDYMQYFTDPKQVFFANATLIKALFYQKNNQHDKAIEYVQILLNLDDVSFILRNQALAILSNIQ